MNKIITVFNKKGGTGKSTLAFSIAGYFDLPILSNDDSIIERIWEKSRILDEIVAVEKGSSVVYDLGGFVTSGLIDVFQVSDIIIVPTLLDPNSIMRTMNTVSELKTYCDDIIIVINRVERDTISRFSSPIADLRKLGTDVFYLNESRAFGRTLYEGVPLVELATKTLLAKHQYRSVIKNFSKILKRIEDGKD